MTSSTSRRLPTIEINGRTFTVDPHETVLQAALRSGIDFPNSCRVGGCATCKCRLVEGEVKELTETGYLLTSEEIEQRHILACQSIPRTDLRIEVDLDPNASRSTPGRIVRQEKVTHDITRLTIELGRPLSYKAGQFTNIGIDGIDGDARSYSFATSAPDPDGRVSFFVRKVPGGRVSSAINDEDLVGRSVRLGPPSGDFWLHPSDAPLLFVAGGSGLAPILAILDDALAAGVSRSVTLLFGAREERDLHALDEIEAIARQWRGEFRFVPVLSSAPAASNWTGERGLVTEKIPALLERGAHAYLCGPPQMIDGAVALLRERGTLREHVHFDRFTTRADVAAVDAAEARPTAGVLDYLKYGLFHVLGLLAVVGILTSGRDVTVLLFGLLVVYMLGDGFFGDDTRTPKFTHPGFLTAQLWLALPLLMAIVFAGVWSVSPGDPLGVGALIEKLTGLDVIAQRNATSFGDHVATWGVTGLMIGLIGTITAHELIHRTWDPVSMAMGRWLLAFSFDTSFAIEHVYGHHRYVSTLEDPATAPRGRNVYVHIVVSTIRGNLSAWKIEVDRLAKKRLGLLSPHNAFLRGHLMSAVLVALAHAMGGFRAALFFSASALLGKALLEVVNYMEHYGLVRNPTTPVQPRHSWNTNRRLSSWTMFNLTRHSHHHAQGELPYHELKPYPDAPKMVGGYLTTLVVALIPPLWHVLMTPKVLAWDRDFATAEERALAVRANAISRLDTLRQANLGRL